MLIDAHVHLWRLDDPGMVWPGPELPDLHRDFRIGDLECAISAAGVGGVILVQSQPDVQDTRRLLQIAAGRPEVLGVVGWADLLAMDAAPRIEALAHDPCLLGLRPMLEDLPTGWILNPHLEPAIEAMIANGLQFDALVRPRHLLALVAFAKRWPDLGIVIDHAAKPDIGKGALSTWRDGIAAFAHLENVCCKLSGLLTETLPGQTPDVIDPYVETLFEVFGPRRLIWGSDWPVLTLASDYAGWLRHARALVGRLAPHGEAQVFGETARRVYCSRPTE